MQTLALGIVSAAGLWLAAVALLMALRADYCRELLARMRTSLEASSWRLQFIEQGLRVLAGVALIVRAPASKLPLAFQIGGWILVATSLCIMALPIRWHGRYGAFWLPRLTPSMIRFLSVFPAIVGPGLIYAAI